MIAADSPDRRFAKLVTIDRNGRMRHLPRAERAFLFSPGDLVIANDAATLPASLHGMHCAIGEPIEVRLAAWVAVRDPTRSVAIAFGTGDHRTRTENRPPPPPRPARAAARASPQRQCFPACRRRPGAARRAWSWELPYSIALS